MGNPQLGINSIYEGIISKSAGIYGVPVNVVKAIITQESNWDAKAVNPSDPSYGLMQLNAKYWGTPTDLLKPEINIAKGTSILANMFKKYGSWSLAFAAYNSGTNRSAEDLQNRIDKNISNVGNYVANVTKYVAWYDAQKAKPEQPKVSPTEPVNNTGTEVATSNSAPKKNDDGIPSTGMIIGIVVAGIIMAGLFFVDI